MIKRIARGIVSGFRALVSAFDWYQRADWLGKAIATTGGGAAVIVAGATFIETLKRGLDPLLTIFLTLLSIALVGLITWIAIEVHKQWPSPDASESAIVAGDSNSVNLGRDQILTTVHATGPTYIGTNETSVASAVFEAQFQELRALDAFIGRKDENGLRELFDLNRIIKFNILLSKKSIFPSALLPSEAAELETVFQDGNGHVDIRYVTTKRGEDGDLSVEFIPGKIGILNTTKKYAESLKTIQEYEASSIIPSDVREKVGSFRKTIQENVSLMFAVFNERVAANKNNLREAYDPKSKRFAAINNTYWGKFDCLRPKADEIVSAVRRHLKVT